MKSFIVTLLTCSVSMSALALFYIAITPLLAKRYSEKGRYYVWLIIVIGLIVPFRPQFNSPIIKIDMPGETMTPVIQIGNGTPITTPIENVALSPALPNIAWWQVAVAIWLAGVIVFLVYHIVKHYCFVKMVRRWSENIADEQAFILLQSLKSEMGLSKQINLYRCSSIGSPMMIGFVKPRILLPTADFSQDELCFIFKHELIHYKRKDLCYKSAVLIATAIHWFNPIVYLMAKAIDIQCELSCDAETVRNTDAETRQHYGETIIGVVKYQSKLKTVLSTNFFGGKKGMKKRIFSIMDMGEKKTGIAILCGALVLTLGTGVAFAANANTDPSNIGNTAINSTAQSVIADQYANRFEKYGDYGLIYDKATDSLFFNGKLVRYFEDYYPVSEDGNAYAGTDYFNKNGIIDVHGVRDLSQLIHNSDGSYDPSGKLIGVGPYSQAEFDARNIDELKNPPQAVTSVENGNAPQYTVEPYSGGSNFMLSGESKENFKKYAEFGLTYDDDNVFRYNGKAVRRFADTEGALSFSRVVENDYNRSVDLIAVRDINGKLTGMSVASKEEFDQRTANMEQSQKEWDEFLKSNPNATSYSVVDGGYNPSASTDNSAGVAYNNPNATGITSDVASAGSYINSDYVDTSLNAYVDYGVSYDKTNRTWMFNGKPIDFLIDTGHHVYMNFSADNTDSNFVKTVEASNGVYLRVTRKSGAIEKIEEMSDNEAVQVINALFG